MITMTANQRAVLADTVSDPDAWITHAESVLGTAAATAALLAKVARWQSTYDARLAAGNYKTRAQRAAEAET